MDGPTDLHDPGKVRFSRFSQTLLKGETWKESYRDSEGNEWAEGDYGEALPTTVG